MLKVWNMNFELHTAAPSARAQVKECHILMYRIEQSMSSGTPRAHPRSSGRPPRLKSASVVQLLLKHYEFTEVLDLRQLPSYSDVNFYFQGKSDAQDQSEFVLKILNCARTSKERALALSALWCHQQEKGLKYTGPILNRQGEMVTVLTSRELLQFQDEVPQEYKEFSARVMRFVPGETLDSLDKQHLTPKLLFEVGAYIGRVDTALQVYVGND